LKKIRRLQKQVRSCTAAQKKQSGTIELSIDNFSGMTPWLVENPLTACKDDLHRQREDEI
jgi:hypothetical protein